MLAREWNGRMHRVAVLADGFAWNGKTYPSLSKIALAITGTRWNGPRFFGLRDQPSKRGAIMKLVASIARGRRWLDELIADPTANTESIAGREGCSVRKVNMTISLAFLAPDLVKAAIDGRLPHGMGVARLCDLPAEWSRQRQMLGLAAL